MTRRKARVALADIATALAAYDEAGAECPVQNQTIKRTETCPKCRATSRESCGLQAGMMWHFVMAVRAALSDRDGTATAAASEDLPVPQDCQARAGGIANG